MGWPSSVTPMEDHGTGCRRIDPGADRGLMRYELIWATAPSRTPIQSSMHGEAADGVRTHPVHQS
jgi:hypothetical protein